MSRTSRLGAYPSRITPFPCGLTSPDRSLTVEQNRDTKGRRALTTDPNTSYLQRFVDDRAIASTPSVSAKSARAQGGSRDPALWYSRQRYDAWRRPHAWCAARDCSIG